LNANQDKEKGTAEIPWNYCKFIIDSEGHLAQYMDPLKEPKKAVPLIEEMLGITNG